MFQAVREAMGDYIYPGALTDIREGLSHPDAWFIRAGFLFSLINLFAFVASL